MSEIRENIMETTTMPEERKCYTVSDLCSILRVSRPTVYSLLKQNRFHWFKIGNGKYRIVRKSFDEWMDSR